MDKGRSAAINRKGSLCLGLLFCLLAVFGAGAAEAAEAAYHPYFVKKLEMVAASGAYENWTDAQRAELDALRKSLGMPEPIQEEAALSEGHLSREEARRIGMAALEAEGGLPEGALQDAGVLSRTFVPAEPDALPIWIFYVSPRGAELPLNCSVEVESPTGQILSTYVGESEEDMRREILRMLEPGDISPEEAEEIARAYMKENLLGYRGLDAKGLDCFYVYARLIVQDELGRVYDFHFNPLDGELVDYFGSYTVCVDPQTGIVWEGLRGNG